MMGLAAALAAKGIVNEEAQEVQDFLSTGFPVLDERLSGRYIGGGVPQGRITEIAGPSSAGKTAIASNIMAEAQRRGGVAIFMDHEKTFQITYAKATFGMTDDPDQWVYRRPMTYEQSWDTVKEILYLIRGISVKTSKSGDTKIEFGKPMLAYEVPVVVVFDSLASMTPQEKFGKASENQGMRDKLALAALTSVTFDVMATIAEMTNTTFVFLNQIRTKPGVMYGDDTTTPGGNAPEFYCSTRLRLGKSILYDKATKTKYGTKVGCEVTKSKISRPFGKCEWEFHFMPDGSGKFQVVRGVIEELKLIGKLETSGAWVTWKGKKWNSMDNLVAHIEANGEYEELLKLFPEKRPMGVAEVAPYSGPEDADDALLAPMDKPA
jgi:RecA/RadA recombinase